MREVAFAPALGNSILATVALPDCAKPSTTLLSTSTRSDSIAGRGRLLPDGARATPLSEKAPLLPLEMATS